MSLRKQSGNMYTFLDATWNPIKGICQFQCSYCYMKSFKLKPIRLVEKELKTNLGEGNFIFVGSSTDMWAEDVPDEWIEKVLEKCGNYEGNRYLFQSKNPLRFTDYVDKFPSDTVLGTTIESNRVYPISQAPIPIMRKIWIEYLGKTMDTMVTIEPILQFDHAILVSWIKGIKPTWVNIGADSKGHNLPEPTLKEVQELIAELREFTKVRLKSNLKRLTEETKCHEVIQDV